MGSGRDRGKCENMSKQEKIRAGIRDILSCRLADIIETEKPHGYELYPDMIDEQTIDILYYLHSQGVWIRTENGEDLTGCCLARLEPLIEVEK